MAATALRSNEEPDTTVIWEAQPRQADFISCPADDVGFGGARGGGKSDAVIGDWVGHEFDYGKDAVGMAFRRERTQLTELIERARQIMVPLGYKWHEADKYFRGPKGGRLRFSYLESDSDADSYQGHSYTRLYPEEMGTFPSEAPINKLQATLRSGNGVPCQMKGTCNPGGPGHQWVKARYKLDQFPNGFEVFRFEFENPFTKKKIEKTRVFIPSKVSDNKFLGDDYVANLFQVGSPNLVRAWLEGDWSVIEGAFFDCWSLARHVVRPFAIPQSWVRIRSMDWGYAAPFSVGWWAVAADAHAADRITIPRGALVRYREWYGRKGVNEGLRLDAEEVAKEIARLEAGEKIDAGVLDPSAFAQNGGPSIAERMYTSHKVGFRPADNTRVAQRGALSGWDAMRGRLTGDDDGNPMIVTFSTCADSIRTIPALQHDELRAEDIDTDGEDHCFGEGTLVDTDSGLVPIEKLMPGRWSIWSVGAWRWNYYPRLTRFDAEVVKLRFNTGLEIVCTPDHRFMDYSGEWRYAKDLNGRDVACDQSLSARQSKNFWASAFISVACISGIKADSYIARSGRRILGLSPKGCISIIRMEIDRTMIPTIWSALRHKSIWAMYTAKKVARAGNSVSRRPEPLPVDGMVLRQANNGTASISTTISVLSWSAVCSEFVRNAGKNIWEAAAKLSRRNSAAVLVAPVRCVGVESIGRQTVYCLTEPVTEAFTIHGGLIVSNCADEWRYACNSRPWIRTVTTKPKGKTLREMTMNDMWKTQRREGRI